jgi:hypothetical protein
VPWRVQADCADENQQDKDLITENAKNLNNPPKLG